MKRTLGAVLFAVAMGLGLVAALATFRRTPGTAVEAPAVAALPPLVGEEAAEWVRPPDPVPPLSRDHATRVFLELEPVLETRVGAGGRGAPVWVFTGHEPGAFVRVRQGDLVLLALECGVGVAPLAIELHPATEPEGGIPVRALAAGSGEETVLEFRAVEPGLYLYHAVAAPPGSPAANGMYGLLLVEPVHPPSEEGVAGDPVW